MLIRYKNLKIHTVSRKYIVGDSEPYDILLKINDYFYIIFIKNINFE